MEECCAKHARNMGFECVECMDILFEKWLEEERKPRDPCIVPFIRPQPREKKSWRSAKLNNVN